LAKRLTNGRESLSYPVLAVEVGCAQACR
jgi:hypothetical protein